MIGSLSTSIAYSSISFISKSVGVIVVLSLCARYLNITEFGVLSFYLVLATVLAIIIDLGLSLKLPKDIARNQVKAVAIVNRSVYIKLIMLLPLGVINIPIITLSAEPTAFTCIMLSVVCYSFFYNFLGAYRGGLDFASEAKLSFVTELFYAILVVVTAATSRDLELVAFSMLIGRLVQLLFVIFWYSNSFDLNLEKPTTNELKACLPYAAQVAIATLLIYLDSLILSWYVSDVEMGIYQAGLRLLIAGSFVISIVNAVFLPKLSKNYSSNLRDFSRLVYSSLVLCSLAAIVAVLVIVFYKENVILIMFGEQYSKLGDYSLYLAAIIFLRYIASTFGTVLTATDGQAQRVKSMLIVVVVLLLSGFLLIPVFGVEGAYIAALISTFLLCCLYIIHAMPFMKL